MIKLGVLPVRSLLLVEGALWAASGGQVFMASLETHTIEVSQAHPAVACSCIPEATRLSAVQVFQVHSGAVRETKTVIGFA